MASDASATSTLRPEMNPSEDKVPALALQDTLKPVEPPMQAAPVGLKLGTDVGVDENVKAGPGTEKQVAERDVERGAADDASAAPTDVYDRFAPRKKHIIVAVVSLAAFLSREWQSDRSPRQN